MSNLSSFLDAHRAGTGAEWNLTGMGGSDMGKYYVSDEEYDTFLQLVNTHIFGRSPRASTLLERHRDKGPGLVDLDLRYETGGILMRRFDTSHIKHFIAWYVATMIYFSRVEDLKTDLLFYHLEKPQPENDGKHHKDGVHIQCPTITTSPKYQYGIRGSMISNNVVDTVFKSTGVCNPPEDVYDVSVIHRNNWFLYGACKPNKSQYKVVRVWQVTIADIAEALDGGDPTDIAELVDIVQDIMTEVSVSKDTLELMKTLSIRRGHTEASPIETRKLRATEWEELMINWGSGKARLERTLPPPPMIEHEGGTTPHDAETALVVTDNVDGIRVTNAITNSDILLAYRLCRECLNAERRAGEYQDWVSLAICLKNISNTEDSFKVWCEVTRRVDSIHKKSRMTETELRSKWNLIKVDSSKKLTMASLQYWSSEDNREKHHSILSENNTDWIVNLAKNTHVNVASFVCRLYKYEFRCCLGQKKGSYEWYQYGAGAHAWKHMRTAVELRSRLSAQVVQEYWTAEKRVGDRYHSCKEEEKAMWDERKKQISKIQRDLEMKNFKDMVLAECQEKFYDDEFISKLNSNAYTVGVANGILELRYYGNDSMSGRPRVYFREGNPDDCVSFQMGRSDPDMEAVSWTPYNASDPVQMEIAAFFERIYPDAELREYVLTLLSSCLEGCNREQKFYVMQGVGSNGKSMIEQLMELTFGDYGTSVSTTIFTRKRPDSGAANPDIITVQKRRYIHMGEPDDNEKINTSIMKAWSGGDRLSVRGLFSDQEKFPIMGKVFMSCNDLPPVSKMDNGTWRRLRVIPHVSVFKDPGDPAINPAKHIYEKDLDLENKLRHWRTAFLSLLVHYYDTRYLVSGLSKEPDCVTAASNKYKEENDMFMLFFGECFVRDSAAVPLSAKEVKAVFREWRRTQGKLCELKEQQVMERMKVACGSGSTEKEFYGIRIAEDAEDLSGALISHMP